MRNEKINYKVREHSVGKVPVILAIGMKEVEERTVSVRRLGETQTQTMTLDAIVAELTAASLPPDMRLQYVAHLQHIAPSQQILLITLEYDQTITNGPPFSVPPAEVQQYYADHYQIQSLAQVDISHTQHGIITRGVKELYEGVYWLQAK